MSAYQELSALAQQELELAGASVNVLQFDDSQILAWVERWGAAPLGESPQGNWSPIDATVAFSDGMQSGKTARMRLALLLPGSIPDLEGHPHWVAFTQSLANLFAPVCIEIDQQTSRLCLVYEQLLYAGTSPQVALYCEKLAYFASLVLPAIPRIRLEAWTLEDVRNLAQQILNEALTLGYQQ